MTGLSFNVPAFSETRVVANLRIPAMSSQMLRDLEAGWKALLDISRQEELEEYQSLDTSLSANLSFIGYFSGGAKTEITAQKSRRNMQSLGLTEGQIDQAMQMFADAAAQMSEVTYDSTVYNRHNNFSVRGNLVFFTMGGEITRGENSQGYRVLSEGSAAGTPGKQAEAGGEFVFA